DPLLRAPPAPRPGPAPGRPALPLRGDDRPGPGGDSGRPPRGGVKGAAAALARALAERRILVVCGAGGVGKTTTAAALAVQAALNGRRVLVCTIDPSRRLATSLGLQKLSDRPRRLDLDTAAPGAAGEAWAMTLDTKRTFDALVERHAPTAEARRRIL